MKTVHGGIGVSYIEERLEEAEWRSKHTAREITNWVNAVDTAKARGYTWFPACDNIRPDGGCAGHLTETAKEGAA